ncbi:hypothetical protein [Microbulbifer yueqingensis]|uniref:Uncharacterized protein n=1 Tax=Microbulbifer yueqingensis TaxID=658219 RepID=A0A1G8UM21_9GAMM|nr:hypothetical protein [Microbulbifer yueqingensis]SDJ54956.1 hypothetical protein SAMN05216212_0192 [Microbulbifer yueqingensis]
MNETMPPDLIAAAATEPEWLRWWFRVLIVTNLAAVFFILKRTPAGRLAARPEALAILVAFILSAVTMNWLYDWVGYVRLLGVTHLVFWTPVYLWVLGRFWLGAYSGPFRYYAIVYLVVAGACLVIDASDLIRYLLGDHRPLHLD